MVRERGAQKLCRHKHIHSVNPLRPTASRKVRKLMAVPGNEIFRSVGPEEFCGFHFLAGLLMIRTLITYISRESKRDDLLRLSPHDRRRVAPRHTDILHRSERFV